VTPFPFKTGVFCADGGGKKKSRRKVKNAIADERKEGERERGRYLGKNRRRNWEMTTEKTLPVFQREEDNNNVMEERGNWQSPKEKEGKSLTRLKS